MSDYNLSNENRIQEKQFEFLSKETVMEFELTNNESYQFQQYTQDILRNYEGEIKPLFQPIPFISGQLPWKEDILKNYREITTDINILNGEQNTLANKIVDNFNFVESEKKRLFNRINNLGNLTGDLNLIATELNDNVTYIKESFQSLEGMDTQFSADSIQKVNILTNEGIITLGEVESVNISEDARIAELSGNGEAGSHHLVRKVIGTNPNNQKEESFRYLSDLSNDHHQNSQSILDGRPDTIFEYQMVNLPEHFKSQRRYYDFEWTKGSQNEDLLRLKLVIDLGEIGPVNWISIIPYFAYKSNGRMIIHSIKTSQDGFEYESIYKERDFLYQELSDAKSTQDLNDLFTGNTSPADASYTGKGVWLFPEKQARYIEIVIDQDQSYNEVIGQSVYYVTSSLNNDNSRIYIPAPEELKESPPGEYARIGSSNDIIYHKEIDVSNEGWRYAIGIRDIHIMRYVYSPKALYVSKLHQVDSPINRISLYANEIIPEEYQSIVSKMNDWITYEVSFDDLNWYRISPMHHEPVAENFPPKIIQLNGNVLDKDMSFELHKSYIETNKDIKQFRYKITLHRPIEDSYKHTTPIVHDIAFKIDKREESI